MKARIEALRKERHTAPYLFPFAGNPREPMPDGIPFRLMDYLELVDWTGRQIRDDKRGYIDTTLPPILSRLGFKSAEWLSACTQIEQGRLVGSSRAIKAVLSHLNRKRLSWLRLPDG